MWIIQKNAVSNEQQDKVQELQISFRSGEKTYSVLINKSMEFSQSLLRVSIGADTIPKTKYQPIADILRIHAFWQFYGYKTNITAFFEIRKY